MDREIKSTSTVEKSTAEFNGWALNFTKNENTNGVLSISVYGSKDDNTVSANLMEDGKTSITFKKEVDKDLVNEVLDELDSMKPEQE